MNKVLNVITLIIMVSVNTMTPFFYAEFDDIVIESAAESTEQDDGWNTWDSLSEDSESEDNSEEDSEEISQTNDEEDLNWWNGYGWCLEE